MENNFPFSIRSLYFLLLISPFSPFFPFAFAYQQHFDLMMLVYQCLFSYSEERADFFTVAVAVAFHLNGEHEEKQEKKVSYLPDSYFLPFHPPLFKT